MGPEPQSTCCSLFVYLELDGARVDGGPELVVHGVSRPQDLEWEDPETELGVGRGYRAEDLVVRLVGVEPAPDGVQARLLIPDSVCSDSLFAAKTRRRCGKMDI